MPRIVTKPFNKQAVEGASNTFYNLHPEMVQNGKRVPLDPCNPKHAAMQSQWMDLYEAYGGNTHRGTVDRKCGECVEKCSCDDRRLHVVVTVDGEPLPENMLVIINGPTGREGSTNKTGEVLFHGIEPGNYSIEAYEETTIETEETVRLEKEIEAEQAEIKKAEERIHHNMSWIDPNHDDGETGFLDSVVKVISIIGNAMAGGGHNPYAEGADAFVDYQEKASDDAAKEGARQRIEEYEKKIGQHQSRIEELKKEIRNIKSVRVGTGNATVGACGTVRADVQIGVQGM